MLKTMLLTWGHCKVQNGAKQVHHRANFEEGLLNPQIGVKQFGK